MAAGAAAGAPSSQLPITTALLAQLSLQVEAADVLPGAFSAEGGAGGAALSRHPKFRALAEFLQRYRDRPAFHGILFARTREAVRSLARLLRASPDLQFVEVRWRWRQGLGRGGARRVGWLCGAAGMQVCSWPATCPCGAAAPLWQVHELMGHGNRRGGGGMSSKAQQVRSLPCETC